MSSSLISRRVISAIISNSGKNCNNRRLLCSGVLSSSPKEPTGSSQTIHSDSPPPPPPPTPEVAPSAASSSRWRGAWSGFSHASYWESAPWTFFKYGIITTLTGATVAAGFATYAYTLDELDERAKRLREQVNQTVGDDASAIDKFQSLLSSAAKTVPAKAIEFYVDLRRALEEQVRGYTEPTSDKLLPDLHPAEQHVFTLVLDLNETLLYSDWKRERGWRTFKRPGVEAFLEHMAKFYEIVVYSDQLSMYVDPVLERLDKNHCIRYRLSRAATKYVDGIHYRDLSKLNRDPRKIIYVSGHALESCLQRENCVPIKPFKLEADDTALLDLIPFLEYVARSSPPDIRTVLESYQGKDIPKEFIERSKDYQRRMQEQRQRGRLWHR